MRQAEERDSRTSVCRYVFIIVFEQVLRPTHGVFVSIRSHGNVSSNPPPSPLSVLASIESGGWVARSRLAGKIHYPSCGFLLQAAEGHES